MPTFPSPHHELLSPQNSPRVCAASESCRRLSSVCPAPALVRTRRQLQRLQRVVRCGDICRNQTQACHVFMIDHAPATPLLAAESPERHGSCDMPGTSWNRSADVAIAVRRRAYSLPIHLGATEHNRPCHVQPALSPSCDAIRAVSWRACNPLVARQSSLTQPQSDAQRLGRSPCRGHVNTARCAHMQMSRRFATAQCL